MLEGVICAGLAETGYASTNRSFTLFRYIRWLVGNYVFAGQMPGLFRRAAERFEALGRPDVAEFALQKAGVVQLIHPPSANAFLDRFRVYVESSTPIALFGFSYCLERMALGRDDAFIRRVKEICPPDCRAYRFLKVHSNVGSDSAHVHEQLALFESFSGGELAVVTSAAYETAQLLARQPFTDQAVSDDEIDRRLRGAGIELPQRTEKAEGATTI